MDETFFEELKRYVRLGDGDQAALRGLLDHARPHFPAISELFYQRLAQHEEARRVFSGPAQIERLKGTLVVWMEQLMAGPWDEAYFARRARIGRVHVHINLPQRYMFGAMNLVRIELLSLAQSRYADQHDQRARAVIALHKILDLELAIMLETYRDGSIDKVQYLERLEKATLRQQLEVTEARYEEVVEKAEALISTIDSDGHILLFNAKCEASTGLSREQASGSSWLDLFVAPERRQEVASWQRDALAGRTCPAYEGPVQPPTLDLAPAAPGPPRRVRWHFTTLPGTGRPVLCAIGIDVTEEFELSTRTRQAERLAALGTLAAGLAHEIRNPLNAAHLQLNVARRRLTRTAGDSGALAAVNLAESEMRRLAGLVDEFLQFARPQPLRVANGDLRATAEVTLALVEPEGADAGVRVSLLPGEPVLAQFDDEKIKQVLLNLLHNAIEATTSGGRVELAVTGSDHEVALTVKDDGRGLPVDGLVFEPFYTTKETGTGLGLSIVHRIVSDHGGVVAVSSRPGETIFRVSFPRSSAGALPGTGGALTARGART